MVFPVVMYGCEIWAIMKAEHWRIYTFELWGWRRLLRDSLEQQRDPTNNPKGNQSWIFIGRTDAKAGTPILGPPDAMNWLIWKDPDAGKDSRQEEKGTTRWDGWMASLTRWTWVWASSWSWWWTGRPGVLQSMGLRRVRYNWATELTDTFVSLFSLDGVR